MKQRVRKSLVGILVVFLVTGLFVARRVSGPGERSAPPFEPDEYRAVVTLSPEDAANRVGERARVCGRVVATNYAREVTGRPTYLNFGRPYPDQVFDVVVWGRYRQNFRGPPEVVFRDERICVMGRISEHEGVPRIEIRGPEQVEIP